MKYLREVTPYFKKTSALNEIGWSTGDTGTSSRENTLGRSSSTWAERKTVTLKLCFLCRNLMVTEFPERTIELHAPDGRSSVLLRCPDEHIANQWFNSIHANIHILMQQAMTEANHILSTAPNNSGEVKHMGWLAEQVREAIPGFEDETSALCCFNVGPASATLAQR